MTTFKPWTPPPGVGVVPPPVHEKTRVNMFFSDGSMIFEEHAGNQNWSAVGDGPSIVAYAVVEEYKPAPELREWWIVGGCEAWDNRREAYYNNPRSSEIIHVREVPDPSREVVAWAAVKGERVTPCNCESSAETVAKLIGGTVVKLTGVRP